MKPLIFTLPDELRDALERDLLAQDDKAIDKHLFPLSPPPHLKPFLTEFQEAVLHLQRGSGTPVIQIRNLPARTGNQFTHALSAFFESKQADLKPGEEKRVRSSMPNKQGVISNTQLGYHIDASPEGYKHLVMLYCAHPGYTPLPTVFTTVDEILHALACGRAKLPVKNPAPDQKTAAGRRYHQAYGALLDEFRRRYALQENPEWREGSGAPRFFSANFHDLQAVSRPYSAWEFVKSNAHDPFIEELYKAAHRVREINRKESAASTEANSCVLFNNGLMPHDRIEGDTTKRCLIAHDAYPAAVEDDVSPAAIFAPASRVDLSAYRPDLEKALTGTFSPVSTIARNA